MMAGSTVRLRVRSRVQIVQQGGALLLHEFPLAHYYQSLREECLYRRHTASEQICTKSLAYDWRVDEPARKFYSTSGGPVQSAFYHEAELVNSLSQLCGFTLRPTGADGTFSYYDQPGSFLSVHRDIKQCDFTLISCLARTGNSESGDLKLYAKDCRTPTAKIETSNWTANIQLEESHSVLLLGGVVPHEVSPLKAGSTRAVSVLCFEKVV